ncbi:MAG TPA: amino acid permease [Acidimicrobiales bacterium]|nr:amino acid permease [Acidimicrobiales bacterium]
MAIGGAIGVGLFLGSASAIHDAGPAVVLSYVVAGGVVFLVLRALGEMAMDRPVSGSFASYAGAMLGPWAGFATAWTYWLMWITTVMAEITAIGIYVRYFFPGTPQWLPALIAVAVLVSVNLISVRWFGEIEFWFALVKILAIVTFVVAGLAIVAFGLRHLGHHGAANLWSEGGVFPKGVLGRLVALQIVTYAFLGVEMIGVTAGEAREPRRELPKAINRVAWRILLFYVGAVVVILMLIPWNQVGVGASPFVQAWQDIGIPGSAAIFNVVVLTSALSSSNCGIFISARMLHTLAGDGHAPRRLGDLSRTRVPALAIMVSGTVLLIGLVLNIVMPAQAFSYITSVATVAVLWVWAMVAISHLVYRTKVRDGLLPRQDFRLPGSPWTNLVILAFIVLVVVLLFVTKAQHIALYAGGIWALLLAGGWTITRRANRRLAPFIEPATEVE